MSNKTLTSREFEQALLARLLERPEGIPHEELTALVLDRKWLVLDVLRDLEAQGKIDSIYWKIFDEVPQPNMNSRVYPRIVKGYKLTTSAWLRMTKERQDAGTAKTEQPRHAPVHHERAGA
jgi:hypothetical protein